MSHSTNNSTNQSLPAGRSFYGVADDVSVHGSYLISIRQDSNIALKIYQGTDGRSWDDVRILALAPLAPPTMSTDTSTHIVTGLIKSQYFKIIITNTDATPQSYMRCDVKYRNQVLLNSLDDSVTTAGIDENGVKHFLKTTDQGVLKTDTQVTIENIQLNGATDSIRIMGSTDQDPANIKLINTDADGKLNVNVTSLTLTPEDDGVSCYGSADGGVTRVILKTEVDGTLDTKDAEVLAKLEEVRLLSVASNESLALIEEGVRKGTLTSVVQEGLATFQTGQAIGAVIDLGEGQTKYNNITFMGYVDTTTVTMPKLIFEFSFQGGPNDLWYSDGTEAAFYKPTGINIWSFYIQRDKIANRYVRLLAAAPTRVFNVYATLSKI